MNISAENLLTHGDEILYDLTYQCYRINRNRGMPYQPPEESEWGRYNEQLEARYQYDKQREQDSD